MRILKKSTSTNGNLKPQSKKIQFNLSLPKKQCTIALLNAELIKITEARMKEMTEESQKKLQKNVT